MNEVKKAEEIENKKEILTQKEEMNAGWLELCFLYMYKERSNDNLNRKLHCRLPLSSYFL